MTKPLTEKVRMLIRSLPYEELRILICWSEGRRDFEWEESNILAGALYVEKEIRDHGGHEQANPPLTDEESKNDDKK